MRPVLLMAAVWLLSAIPAQAQDAVKGEVVAEIGEVVSGTRPGRQGAEVVTLFKSVGVAVEDVVTADLVYREALKTTRVTSS